LARQDIAVELYYDGAWHDLVTDDDVLAEQPIVIKRGQGDESAGLRPLSIVARLANDDDKYRTTNPESPLYGKAGRNTRIRVSVGGVVRGTAEVAVWRCGQSRDFVAEMLGGRGQRGKAWCDVEAYGILARLAQWTRTIERPMTRWLAADPDAIGMWPLEDGGAGIAVGNAALAQVIPNRGNVGLASVDDVTFRGDDGPAGGSECLVLRSGAAGAEVSGRFHRHTTSGWQYLFHFRCSEAPPDGTYRTLFYNRLTNANTVEWKINNANFLVEILSPGGTSLFSVAGSYSGTVVTGWVRCRLKVTVSGGTVTVEPAWYGQDGITWGFSGTYSATSTGALMDWNLRNEHSFDVAFSHVYGTTDTSLTLDTGDAVRSFDGFRDEGTAARWYRLLAVENGLPYEYRGDFTDVSQMGPQRPGSLDEQTTEIRTTEDGLVFDSGDAIQPVFLLRNQRLNQTPALTLTPTDFPALPDEVTDDLGVANIVTAQQNFGASITTRDDTSPLGTQDPPDGMGEIRHTVDVNVADELVDLPQHANYWLRRKTVDLPRYPQVTLNLAAAAAAHLVDAVDAVDVGDVIEITGFRENTIRLHVLGWTETIGQHRRIITFNCAPDQQFVVGQYSPTSRDERADSASTVLKTAVTESATALTFRTTDAGDCWRPGTNVNGLYDVFIEGERMMVTSMGSPSLVSGAYDQAATVVRSTNGVKKALSADSPIHVWNPARWALSW
jgi:hypothetical protein